MLKPVLAVVGLLVVLQSCQSSGGSRTSADTPALARGPLEYIPPKSALPPPIDGTIWAPVHVATAKVIASLLERGFTIKTVRDSLNGRRVIAIYGGEPTGFVDCGILKPRRGGDGFPATGVAASVPNAHYRIQATSGQAVVERELELDVRIVADLYDLGDGVTSVVADLYFVLTRLTHVTANGKLVTRRVESMRFRGDERGAFDDGLSCISKVRPDINGFTFDATATSGSALQGRTGFARTANEACGLDAG